MAARIRARTHMAARIRGRTHMAARMRAAIAAVCSSSA
jgi:hypothetical protein